MFGGQGVETWARHTGDATEVQDCDQQDQDEGGHAEYLDPAWRAVAQFAVGHRRGCVARLGEMGQAGHASLLRRAWSTCSVLRHIFPDIVSIVKYMMSLAGLQCRPAAVMYTHMMPKL